MNTNLQLPPHLAEILAVIGICNCLLCLPAGANEADLSTNDPAKAEPDTKTPDADPPEIPPTGDGSGPLPAPPAVRPGRQPDPGLLPPIDGMPSSPNIPPFLSDFDPFPEDPPPDSVEFPEDLAASGWEAYGDTFNSLDFTNLLSPFIGDQQGLGGRPSGFGEAPGAVGGLGAQRTPLLAGFNLSASLAGTYDSNPSQGYISNGSNGQSDFYLSLGGTVSYLSRPSVWTFGATYTGNYNQYFNQSELSGYNQSASVSLSYDKGPLAAALYVGLGFGSGANRYYGAVVDQLSLNYGLSARYAFSPKTSLTANFSQQLTSADGYSDTGSFDLSAAALWRYSPLTEFGPGIRYTSRSGDSQEHRTSIGPTFSFNHKLSARISLTSRIGMDFAQYENGDSADPSFSTSIGLSYQPSELWGMNFSAYRDMQADPASAGGFTEVTALRLGYWHKIRQATLNLGLGYETNTTESPDSDQTRADLDFLTIDGSVSMPVFSNTCNATLFARYRNESGDPANSWNSIQVGFAIHHSF